MRGVQLEADIATANNSHAWQKHVKNYRVSGYYRPVALVLSFDRNIRFLKTDLMLFQLKNKRPTWCHLLFYFTSYVLNMFRALIYPSSGACGYSVELPHWLYCSWFDVCWSFGVVGLEWYPCCRLKTNLMSLAILFHFTSACNTDTTPTQPHRNSNKHRTKNNKTNVVIEQNSRKFLMMDILMSETCWAHKWNKIASDIKLLFYSSTITMMHGPINIRLMLFQLSSCIFRL